MAISPYIEPSSSPLASCCGRVFTAWPPLSLVVVCTYRVLGWGVARAARSGSPPARPVVVLLCAAGPGLAEVGGAGLHSLPRTLGDLVHGELLVGGVAELVEGDLAGDAFEVGLLDGVDDGGAQGVDVAGDLAAVGVDGGLHCLDDGGGGVVGVRAVGAVVTLVALGLVRLDERLGGGQGVGGDADGGGEVALGGGARGLDVGGGEHAVAAEQRDLDAAALELLGDQRGLVVLAAVVEQVGAGVLDLGDEGTEVLVTGVDVVGADDGAAELLELLVEDLREAGAVGLLVVDDEDLLLLEAVVRVVGGEAALELVGGGG